MKAFECKKLKSWCKRVGFGRKVQMSSRRTKVHKLKSIDINDKIRKISGEEQDDYEKHIVDLADVSSISARSFCESGIESLETSPESKGSPLDSGNLSLPAISVTFENFATRNFPSSTPLISTKTRRTTIGTVDSQFKHFLPGYIDNSPDNSSLDIPPRRRSFGVPSDYEESSIIPKKVRKFASWLKSSAEESLPARKKFPKRKHKSLGTENENGSNCSSDGLLEFLEGLSPNKTSGSCHKFPRKSYSSSLQSDSGDESPLLPDSHPVKPFIARRKALQTQFDKLKSEAKRLKEKDLKIKQKFIELQQKRVLLSIDLSPNSSDVQQDIRFKSKRMGDKQKNIYKGLRKLGLSKSTPNLVGCSEVEKLITSEDV